MKRYMLLAIVAVCCAATANAYEPLTTEEAAEYILLFPQEAAADIIALDAIENAAPVIEFATFDVIVTGDEVIIRPRSPMVITVGNLGWRVTVPEQRAPYEPETHSRLADILASGLVGVGIGVLLAMLLN